jgi:nucleoside 2-deoxyribosyltransferase
MQEVKTSSVLWERFFINGHRNGDMRRIYLAQGYGFSALDRSTGLQSLVSRLENIGFEVDEPFQAASEKNIDFSQAGWAYTLSQMCKQAIEGSDVLLVVTNGQSPDVGAMVEAGYATGLGKLVCYFHDSILVASDISLKDFFVDAALLTSHSDKASWDKCFYQSLEELGRQDKSLCQYLANASFKKENPNLCFSEESSRHFSKKPQLYLAHDLGSIDKPLSEDEQERLEKYVFHLEKCGYEVIESRKNAALFDIDPTHELGLFEYVKSCETDLKAADCVMVVLNDNVPRARGMYYLGLAAAYQKPICIYRSNTARVSDSDEYPLNLMISIADEDKEAWQKKYYSSVFEFSDSKKVLCDFLQTWQLKTLRSIVDV